MRVSGFAIATVVASALAGGALGLWPVVAERLPEPVLVTLGGRVPPRAEQLPGWLTHRAELEGQAEVLVRDGDGTRLVPRAQLGIRFDEQVALSELARPREPSSVLARLRAAFGGSGPEPFDLPLSFQLDSARAAAWLAEIAPSLRRDPVDARLDLAGHERIEAQPGRELDLGASLSRLAVLGAGDELTLAFRSLPPAVPTSALVDVDPSIVLSEFETDFARRGGPRVRNIARAARYLDGTLLAPGEVWSFNRTVGPRTVERGFVDAPVIVADEVEPGVGGGVCQVATTLFAAGVLGGLDVVQRRSHSRPSG
ncbi:MAG TPA: VanW family protein, partial [Polyangiaceae bacterium]|nr:VanW family protein [Polyangiaceae bacterium]